MTETRPVLVVTEVDDITADMVITELNRRGVPVVRFTLAGPLWGNHPLRIAAADYKPAQLALARRLGIRVPPTLVTNDPDEAREFVRAQGDAIFKTLRWTPYRREGVPVTGWATPVTADEIDDSVRVTPHLFQARVHKAADVRVLIAGRHTFAVRIDSELLDWRQDYSNLTYAVERLPDRVDKALHACLDSLELVSGSFDLAVDREGNYWWLELNPNGQWGWLETETGLGMSAAFAGLLMEGDRR
ncbi:hypothetical protein [Streptomyces sp. NPDC001758]